MNQKAVELAREMGLQQAIEKPVPPPEKAKKEPKAKKGKGAKGEAPQAATAAAYRPAPPKEPLNNQRFQTSIA